MGRSRRTTSALAAAGLCLPLALVGCSSDNTTSTTASTTVAPTTTAAAGPVNAGATVEMREFEYTPADITIEANQAVSWKNVGAAKHTVTAEKGQAIDFKSPTLVNGDAAFVQTFSAPGTYQYFCSIHGADKMKGTITVTAA